MRLTTCWHCAALYNDMLNPALGLAIVLVNFIDQGSSATWKPLAIYIPGPIVAIVVAVVVYAMTGYRVGMRHKVAHVQYDHE
jgi:glycerol uptake facilitator-like aquaporin